MELVFLALLIVLMVGALMSGFPVGFALPGFALPGSALPGSAIAAIAIAADIASTSRKAEYREATGEITMPSEFDVVSASAGDMFMGAFIPGLILVGIYMIYILVQALVRPNTAPPVPYEGRYDWRFALQVLLALVPPLTLIFAVLGSIITGIATVNQAGAIGAIGALIMGGYRLTAGQRNAFVPAIIAVLSLAELLVVLNRYDINVKNITGPEDVQGIGLAVAGVFPSLVNYLPNRVYLSSETAPPPMNPKLQHCLEGHVFAYYDANRGELRAAIDRAAEILADARALHAGEVAWRTRAAEDLLPGLTEYAGAIGHSIGLRVQERLTKDQAREIAACKSVHRDISLHF